jgi:hypothetical protein
MIHARTEPIFCHRAKFPVPKFQQCSMRTRVARTRKYMLCGSYWPWHCYGVLHRSMSHSTRSTAGHLQEYSAVKYRHDWVPISAVRCRDGSYTIIETAKNSPTAQNGVKAPCWGQHTQFSCFACSYLNTNSVPKKYHPCVSDLLALP